MKVRLLSVPHTGTRFTIKMLKDNGIEYQHGHFWGTYKAPIIYEQTEPAIIPLRDIDEVRASWSRRHTSQYHMGLDACWKEMVDFIDANPSLCYLLHIDNPAKRDNDLMRIAGLVGKNVTTDFSIKVAEGQP